MTRTIWIRKIHRTLITSQGKWKLLPFAGEDGQGGHQAAAEEVGHGKGQREMLGYIVRIYSQFRDRHKM